MKQKTIYQKPAIQQVMALTAGGFAQSVNMNANYYGTPNPSDATQNANIYTTSTGSWD